MRHGERVKTQIIHKGIELWRLNPSLVTMRRIGKELGMTHAAVRYHFGSVANMLKAIAEEAVRANDIDVIRHLIVAKNPAVKHLTRQEKQRYLDGV